MNILSTNAPCDIKARHSDVLALEERTHVCTDMESCKFSMCSSSSCCFHARKATPPLAGSSALRSSAHTTGMCFASYRLLVTAACPASSSSVRQAGSWTLVRTPLRWQKGQTLTEAFLPSLVEVIIMEVPRCPAGQLTVLH